jgi:hypothetical protein
MLPRALLVAIIVMLASCVPPAGAGRQAAANDPAEIPVETLRQMPAVRVAQAIDTVTAPGHAAAPFEGATGGGRALDCLTAAVYYEARSEPLDGQRAVAQVVLNRVRHPAFPRSICGVVFQGRERRTGCQFSFTCDGSLLRAPAAGPWRQAEEIARAALAGQTEPSVGTATHYHADYVLPKWAFQLGKIGQIGRHIFYRFAGGWGRSSALSAAYSGREAIPALNLAALRERLEDGTVPLGEATEAFVPGLTVTPAEYDRHAASDVGGRIDTTKEWRLTIPDPAAASSRYRAALGEGETRAAAPTAHPAKDQAVTAAPAPTTTPVAALGTGPSSKTREVALK